MPTSCATSAATRCIRRRCASWTSSACSTPSCGARTSACKAVAASSARERVQLGDFSGLPERYAFIAMMPQWEFLDFLVGEAKKLPAFSLRMQAEVTGLLTTADGRVGGVRGRSPEGEFEIGADCTVGCDGRHSTVRAAAGLAVEDVGAPIDVLWFRVGRDPGNEDAALARVGARPLRRHHRSRRLLAVRLRHSQGRRRGAAAPADRGVPRAGGGDRAAARVAHRRRRARGATSSC